jgi:hypothetical protein
MITSAASRRSARSRNGSDLILQMHASGLGAEQHCTVPAALPARANDITTEWTLLKPPPVREPSDGRFEHDGVPDPRSHEDQLRRPHCVSTGPTPSQQPLIAPAANPKCAPPLRHSDESIGVTWLLHQARPDMHRLQRPPILFVIGLELFRCTPPCLPLFPEEIGWRICLRTFAFLIGI